MMSGDQLALFDIPSSSKKQSEKQRLNGLADWAIQECIDKGIDPMLLAAEFQFRLLCEELDQWPVRLRKQFVAKLVREYIGYDK